MKSDNIDHNESEPSKIYTNNRRAFLKVAGASLVAASAGSVAEAARDDDDRQAVTLPLGSTGLIFGQSLRITLTNLGERRMNVKPTILDAGGAVLKQPREPLVVEPGQMSTFEISRTEVGGRERTALLRADLAVRRDDLKNLWIASEVVADANGATLYVVISIIGILIGG